MTAVIGPTGKNAKNAIQIYLMRKVWTLQYPLHIRPCFLGHRVKRVTTNNVAGATKPLTWWKVQAAA